MLFMAYLSQAILARSKDRKGTCMLRVLFSLLTVHRTSADGTSIRRVRLPVTENSVVWLIKSPDFLT